MEARQLHWRNPIQQQQMIENHIKEIIKLLGLNIEDPNLKDTPKRIARMYVDEIFSGLNENNFPKITTFPNTEGYDQIIGMHNQTIWSTCSHHFVPFKMRVSIGYIPSKKGRIIGASKLIRITEYFAKRPQTQEILVQQIANYLEKELKPVGVIVYIPTGEHLCCQMRGVKNITAKFLTSEVRGAFKKNPQLESKFIQMVSNGGN